MRKLASIQKVWKIEPIEGADRLELASIEGWKTVVNKGQFHHGDLCVYFEIDSFLPIDERFEFLRSSSYKKTDIMGEGFRLRSMKFRGQISQGLALPVDSFPEIQNAELGQDVSEILGVRKWEIEEKATTDGYAIGSLPYDVPHTDETRVQEEPGLIQAFAGLQYYISTKLDGSSHSLSLDEDGFHICGHNYEYSSGSFYDFVKKRDYEMYIRSYVANHDLKTLTVQGEFCAPGIQKNRLKLQKPEWYVFTIRVDGKRVGLHRMKEICNACGFKMVPVEEIDFDLPSKYPTVEAILARADGQYPNGGPKEGIVIRTVEPVYNEIIGGPLSMKAVSNKYLLKTTE